MKTMRVLVRALVLVALLVGVGTVTSTEQAAAAGGQYVLLAWNDLGMHCYNKDFRDMAVLPPYNTLWAQVVKAGNPPVIVTSGIIVKYSIIDNTYSVGKTNFWSYEDALFGVSLPDNVGLKGNGLRGRMRRVGDHYLVEGIPLTEFNDSTPTTPQPYQLARIIVRDSATGVILARQTVVAPVSSEMRCNKCHIDGGSANPTLTTGRVATNILKLHDINEGTTLMAQRPVLCAKCHASNALGAPGDPLVQNLSNAMHARHSDYVANTINGCYNCHPGPKTHCLRDVMYNEEGLTCIHCHGPIQKVALNANPWLNEPRCDSCHDVSMDNALYRFSKGHGGLYCEACHDSTHAIAPSSQPRDGLKFMALQGTNEYLEKCTLCHTGMQAAGVQSIHEPGIH